MSRNLVELIRRHHSRPRADGAGCAQGGRRGSRRGHRRGSRACRRGLGAAGGHGLRHLDLLRRPAGAARRTPRARLHGTACFAADRRRARRQRSGRASGSSSGERAPTARCRWPRPCAWASATPRPRSATATSIDAGPDALARAITGATRRGVRARVAEPAAEPVLTEPGDWSGLRRALAELGPEQLLDDGRGREGPRPRRRRLPGRDQVALHAAAPRATRSSSSPTATRATQAPTSTST